MAKLTDPDDLDHLHTVLLRCADMLDNPGGDGVRQKLVTEIMNTAVHWEGRVGDTFRHHIGSQHRQRHLRVAADRLRDAARAAKRAADEARARSTVTLDHGTSVVPPVTPRPQGGSTP